VRHDDPDAAAREYASEARLAARAAIYRHAEGPSPLDVAFGAVAEARPRRVLEVGCGPGELSEAYVDASIRGEGRRVPPFAGALRVRRSASVFVAEGPRGPG
jgi:hypothetical protein